MVDYIMEYEGLVLSVSNVKSREYPMIPKEDITQELWLWFVSHPNKVEEWHALENPKESVRLFAKALHNAAHKFCQKEKARTIGYQVDDLFYYRREIVEDLLPSVLSGNFEVNNNVDYSSNVRETKAPNEGGNLQAMQADISRAFDLLKEEQQNILYLWYYNKGNSKSLGKAINANEKTARMKVTRAIDGLIRKLGGTKPYKDRDYKQKKRQDSGTNT